MPFTDDSTDEPRRRNIDPRTDGSQIREPRTPKHDVIVPPLPDGVTLPEPRQPDARLSLVERFEAFHELNPHVYTALVRLARRYLAATGDRKQSVQRLIEIARWDEKIRTRGESDFEINNDYAAFYSRLIMWRERDLADVFQMRRSHEADLWIANLIEREQAAA